MEYTIRVSISASLASDVCVDLPIRILNFLSIDTLAPLGDDPAVPRAFSDDSDAGSEIAPLLPPFKSHSDVANVPRSPMQPRSASCDGFNFQEPGTESPEDPKLCNSMNNIQGTLDDDCDSDEEVDLVLSRLGADQGQSAVIPAPDTRIGPQDVPFVPTHPSVMVGAPLVTHEPLQDRRRSQSARVGPNSFVLRVQEKLAQAERACLSGSDSVEDACPSHDDGGISPKALLYPSATKAPRLHAALALLSESSAGSCTDLTSLHPHTYAVEAGTSVDSFLSELGSGSVGVPARRLRAESAFGDVKVASSVEKPELSGNTSGVKRRIEAFEAKMKNA